MPSQKARKRRAARKRKKTPNLISVLLNSFGISIKSITNLVLSADKE